MPVLEYKCPQCGKRFQELVKSHEEKVLCPNCKREAERVWSGEMYSSTGKPPRRCTGHCDSCDGCK